MPYDVLSVVLAFILLIAASLKFYDLWTTEFNDRQWQAAIVAVEWLLAGWLLSAMWRQLAWAVAIGASLIFSGVSFHQMIRNADTCGCLGTVRVDPRLTLGFDILALMALMVFRPRPAPPEPSSLRQRRLATLMSAVALVGVGALLFREGNPTPVVAGTPAATGLENAIQPTTPGWIYDLGYVRKGSTTTFRLAVPNRTDQERVVTEVRSECSCMTVTSRPDRIPPNAVGLLEFSFAAPTQATEYRKAIHLKTEGGEVIAVQVQARVGMPLRVEPAAVDLGVLEAGKPVEREILVVNEGDESVRLLYCTSGRGECQASAPKELLGAKSTATLLVKIQVKAGSSGEAMLSVHTNHPAQQVVQARFSYSTH